VATFGLFEFFEVWGKYLMPFSVHIRVKTTRESYFYSTFMWLLLVFLTSLNLKVWGGYLMSFSERNRVECIIGPPQGTIIFAPLHVATFRISSETLSASLHSAI
jgi:hypothetical protein